jgi:hypothetical protein
MKKQVREGSSGNNGMKQQAVDPEKIREFRSATIARIKETKIEAEKKKILEEEEKRKESQAFRIKWREKVKQKRQDDIIEIVDKLTVKDTLPELQTNMRTSTKQLNFLQEKAANEKSLQCLISDLEGHSNDYLALNKDSGAFKLSISENKIPSIEFTSGVDRRASVHYLQKLAAFGLQVERRISKIRDSALVRDAVDQANFGEKSQPTASAKGFSVTNDVQLCSLVQDLIKDGPDSQSHVTSGIMESILNISSRKVKSVTEKTLERRNTLTSEMFAQRQVSMFVKMPHTYDADEHKGLVSLCDGYYLIGPDRSVMVDGAKGVMTEKGSTRSFKPFVVEPQVLSTNFRHELPPEMTELLPAYCFPSGIQIKCTEVSNSHQRRNSIGAKEEIPLTSPEIKKNKKPRVFFPSDYSIKANNTATTSTTSTSPTVPSGDSSLKNSSRSTFVIKLGDHTYQYYCLCMLQPVSVLDEIFNVEFETFYCICLLMKFPLVSLISNIVDMCDTIVFNTPVESMGTDTSSTHPGVRAIEDLIVKLKRHHIQAYPYFMKANLAESVDQTNLCIDSNKRGNEFLAFMSDLSLGDVMTGNASYRRGYFQRYFSSFPLTCEQISEEQISTMFQTLGKSKFVPGSTHRSERELEETFHLLLWSLPVLVNFLLLDQIVLALGCAMMEMKIIVCHKDPNVVSAIIMALINLLRPLKWCSPLIISLPDSLTDFIDSPVPIIVGLRQLPPNFELQERCVLIDPDVKKIHFHPKDLIENQTIILPNGSRLAHYLRSIANTIKTVSRRKKLEKLKLMKLKKIMTKNDNTGTNTATAIAAAIAVEKSSAHPLSFENDASSEDCATICGAVNQFSATVANHILALVNTAIQFQSEERRIARDKRRIVKHSGPLTSDSNPERRHSRRQAKPPLVRDSSQDGISDISALDDSVSDITYTDISSHRKNGSGTEVSSAESVNSTTSSLPSIQTGAPILAIKDLRPYEQTFINKLTETQMYSNYCQARKSESPPPTVADGKDGTNVSSDGAGNGGANVAPSSASQGKDSAGNGNAASANLPPFIAHVLEVPQPIDSMVELFHLMLCGVTPASADTISMYHQEYERIYGASCKTFTLSDCEKLLINEPKRSLPTMGKSRRRLQRLLDKLFDEMADKELPKIQIQPEELRYCSGLLCNGFCNTESCDAICLSIWQRKVRLLRKRQAALQIVSEKYESTIKLQQGETPAPTDSFLSPAVLTTGVSALTEEPQVFGTSNSDSKLKFINSDGVRLEAVKHGKETNTQYVLRQKVIEAQMQRTFKASPSKQSYQHGKQHRKVRVQAMTKEIVNQQLKIHVKTLSDSNNRYVTTLAKYYAEKEKKYLRRLRRRSHACIHRALRKYLYRFRTRKRQRSAIVIQSNFRGYRIRKIIPVLVEELYARISQRMIQRCLATIRIRNHIRKNSEAILNVFERKKIARRLAKTNIPVRHSVTKENMNGMQQVSSSSGTGTSSHAGTASAGTFDAKRQLTINERYISDAAPGLLTTATAMLVPTPKNGNTQPENPQKSNVASAIDNSTSKQPSNFTKPSLLSMNSTSSVSSIVSDVPARSEAVPPHPPKRRNSGSGSLSSAAYDFMVHGIKRRSIQESFRHPFANKKYSARSVSPPPNAAGVQSKVSSENSAVFGHEAMKYTTPSEQAMVGIQSVPPPPVSGSPPAARQTSPTIAGNVTSLFLSQPGDSGASSLASSTLSSPSNGSLIDTQLQSRPPTDFSPELQRNVSAINAPPLKHPAGIADRSASPVAQISESKSSMLVGTEAMVLSPFSVQSSSLDAPSSGDDKRHLQSEMLFSPTTFPVVSSDYDESDDEEKKFNRAKTMEKKLKLNMIDKSRSKDFLSLGSQDLLGVQLGSKSRSNDDLSGPMYSKSGDEVFSAFGDDRPRSTSELDEVGDKGGASAATDGFHAIPSFSTSSDSLRSNVAKPLPNDNTIRTSLSLGLYHQVPESSAPTPRAVTIDNSLITNPSHSYKSPSGERKNVTPIGRYTQSQHMIIPFATANSSSSPRLTAGGSTDAIFSFPSTVTSMLPPTHPPRPLHLQSTHTESAAAISTPIDASHALNHTVSLPNLPSNSGSPTLLPAHSGVLSHIKSAESMLAASDADSKDAHLHAAATALLSGRATPVTVANPPAASSGIPSGLGAPNVSPVPMPSRFELKTIPSTGGDTVIDDKELYTLSSSASFRFNYSEFDDPDELEDDALNAERQFPPFKTLGEPVFEVYSRQQRDAIMTLWERLVNGIEVKKHSRNSKPKVKVIFCDRPMTKLSWKTPASKTFFGGASTLMGAGYNRLTGGTAGNAVDSDFEDETPLQGMRRMSSQSDVNKERYSINRLDSERVIEFKDIIEIRTDASTDVLRRSESKGYLYGGFPSISILTSKRSLDFEVSDERLYSELLQGFTLIRNYYQKLLREEQSNESTGFALWHHKETSYKNDP